MPRIDETTRRQRIERVWLTVQRYRNGILEAEIAAELGLERRTINNYLRELELEGRIIKDGRLWYPAPWQETRLRPFELTPEEALSLYLGARLLAKQHDRRNEPAETALLKLARALRDNAGAGREIEQAARELAQRPVREGYQPVFRTIMRGYIYRKKLRLTYKPLGKRRAFQTLFSIYLIEPSLVGSSLYIIGHSSAPNALRAYKLGRIRSAELTHQEYTIPANFPGLDILRNAWNIMLGKETLHIVLRFSPRVRERVLETIWHPSERKSDDPEKKGWLRWEAEIANTQDLLPWLRGWGADCEVVAPEGLRRTLKREAQRLGNLYGVQLLEEADMLLAHWRKSDRTPQFLIDHLENTAKLTEQFAAKIGLPDIGKILGLLHDFGKASDVFQSYLRSGEGLINPDEDDYVNSKELKGKIDHSTAGAQLVYQKLKDQGREGKLLGQILALALASHHSGLIDCLKPDGRNEFQRRIEKPDKDTHLAEARQKLSEIEQQLDEILSSPIEQQFFDKVTQGMKESNTSREVLWFKSGLLVRFLLSCLLDADRLDTADFEFPGNKSVRNYGKYIAWDELILRLEKKFETFEQETAQMKKGSRAWEVNQLRAQVAQASLEAARKPKGIYQLTVPTGGGKTLSSLRFALHHAKNHNMDRIFYIVPYTTIIEQNAKEIRRVLHDMDEQGKHLGKIVLEHHSNFFPSEDAHYRHNLLTENWDAPIVFTTQVQFFETLFGAGTRDARRMHQLANSVIIFDEVQTVPIKLIRMFTTAVRFLTHDCGSTVVLCTATQPPFDKLGNPYAELHITQEQHIVQNEDELFAGLKRVEVHDARKPGGLSNAEIADLVEQSLQEKGSVLLVVNTRAIAKALYQEIKERNLADIYHLSTNMCPQHRLDVLENQIKPKLRANEPVICVSTQLVEAGVDIDFGAVIRSLAGLDSIAQAAGRCNRHGERANLGSVWVINPQEENLARLFEIQIGKEKTQTVLDNFQKAPYQYDNDRIGLRAIAEFFERYFQINADKMKYPVSGDSPIGHDDNLFNVLSTNPLAVKAYQRTHQASPDILLRQSFQSAGRAFSVIDAPTRGVIVPYADGKELIASLCSASELENRYTLLKRAQRFSINLYEHQFANLAKMGVIHEVQQGAGIYYLDEAYYSQEFGWSDEPVGNAETLIL